MATKYCLWKKERGGWGNERNFRHNLERTEKLIFELLVTWAMSLTVLKGTVPRILFLVC